MSQFATTKASQIAGVISKLPPWQSFSNTYNLYRDVLPHIARRQSTYCSSRQTGSLEAQSRAVTFAQAHPAGQDLEDLQPSVSQQTRGTGLHSWATCKATTLVPTQGETASTWFARVWLLPKSGRCKHRRKVDRPAELSSHAHPNDVPGNLTKIRSLFFILLPLPLRSKNASVEPARDKSQKKPRAGIIYQSEPCHQ